MWYRSSKRQSQSECRCLVSLCLSWWAKYVWIWQYCLYEKLQWPWHMWINTMFLVLLSQRQTRLSAHIRNQMVCLVSLLTSFAKIRYRRALKRYLWHAGNRGTTKGWRFRQIQLVSIMKLQVSQKELLDSCEVCEDKKSTGYVCLW